MTSHGKLNLFGMFLLPVAASVAALIAFGPRPDTLAAVFAMNLVPMLIAAPVSGLLLRGAGKAGGKGRGIALWPTLLPAVVGAIWYLWRALVPNPVAPGAEMLAGPQYLLLAVLLLCPVAWVACRFARAR